MWSPQWSQLFDEYEWLQYVCQFCSFLVSVNTNTYGDVWLVVMINLVCILNLLWRVMLEARHPQTITPLMTSVNVILPLTVFQLFNKVDRGRSNPFSPFFLTQGFSEVGLQSDAMVDSWLDYLLDFNQEPVKAWKKPAQCVLLIATYCFLFPRIWRLLNISCNLSVHKGNTCGGYIFLVKMSPQLKSQHRSVQK